MKYKEFLVQLHDRTKPRPAEDEFKARVAEVVRNFDGRSLDDLNDQIQRHMEEGNRTPRREFAGLSPEQMHHLLYYPLGENSPVRMRSPIEDEILDKIGFLRLVEEFLKIVKRDGAVKLTAKLEALPRNVLTELYDHHFIPHWPIDDRLIALRHQDDWSVMGSLHAIVRISKLVRKIHGKLVLTKLGEKMLSPECREQLFRLVLETFTRRFDWAYNDGYPDFPLCRDAFGFSIYLIARFGETERGKDFYAERFLNAFPMSLMEFESLSFGTPEDSFSSCYRIRTFDRFLEWFNFVTARQRPDADYTHRTSLIKRSEFFNGVFIVI